jgi:secreted trypsin-like serine protease
MILNKTQIFIIPSLNPDGYEAGTRGNANGADLNRDFPDVFTKPADTETGKQPETIAVMRLLHNHTFTNGFNTHGGSVVCSYPFDGNPDPSNYDYYASPDDDLYRYLCSIYANTHATMSQSTEFPGGMTNGNDWYPVYGGLQDYAYLYFGSPHVTLELSEIKNIPESQIQTEWESNQEAMLLYTVATHMGIRGTVTANQCPGTNTSQPLKANITFTHLVSGDLADVIHHQAQPTGTKSGDQKIVGGFGSVQGEFPYMVSLQALVNGQYKHFCGGTLLSPNWVLTAGHCQISGYTIRLAIGVYNVTTGTVDPTGEYVGYSNWIAHPLYNSSLSDNDLSLIKLAYPSNKTTFAVPVFMLPEAKIAQVQNTGNMTRALGWGRTTQGGVSSPILQQVDVPIASYSDCLLAYPDQLNNATMICAGLAAGGKDACQGDSGGPLLSSYYPRVQIGITSYGYGCALPLYYGVYTKLSNYSNFVKQYVTDLPAFDTSTIVSATTTRTPSITPSPSPSPCQKCEIDLPRTTSNEVGRYQRVLLPGQYHVKVESKGCVTQETDVVVPAIAAQILSNIKLDFVLNCDCPFFPTCNSAFSIKAFATVFGANITHGVCMSTT